MTGVTIEELLLAFRCDPEASATQYANAIRLVAIVEAREAGGLERYESRTRRDMSKGGDRG